MKKRFLCFVIIVLVSFSFPAYLLFNGFSEAADIYAGTEANMLLTYRVNQSIYARIKDSGLKYDDFTLIQTDSDGKISAILIDSIKLNLIASELVITIIDSIKSVEYGEFGIPLGNAFGSRLFSGRGPKINCRVVPLGTVASDIKSVFQSAGINQSLHRIILEFKVCVSLMTPFAGSSSEFTASLCIAETVIVGKVPNVIWSLGKASGDLEGYN
ncbi:MAG: sporulation protein YunB [Firmicutes bacterium HGW-Firmicutes-21]|nr:MAG: sporulation protein YunB [Firmicutes bacterium HGW-Firmicutes-21]